MTLRAELKCWLSGFFAGVRDLPWGDKSCAELAERVLAEIEKRGVIIAPADFGDAS